MDSTSISQIITEINNIRLNPKTYAKKLRTYTQYFEDKVLRIPTQKNGIMTTEGASAFQEAATYLETVPKLKSLISDDALTDAAQALSNEMTYHKDFISMDKIDRTKIISEYGQFEGSFGQSTDFGSNTPELVVMNLIVDDGDPQRRNRAMLFSDKFTKIGCGSNEHPTFRACTVVLLATKFNKSANAQSGKKNVVRAKPPQRQNEEFQQEEVYVNNQQECNEGFNVDELEMINYNIDEMNLPKGVNKIDKKERFVMENGKQIKITKIVMFMDNGEINTQLFKTQM